MSIHVEFYLIRRLIPFQTTFSFSDRDYIIRITFLKIRTVWEGKDTSPLFHRIVYLRRLSRLLRWLHIRNATYEPDILNETRKTEPATVTSRFLLPSLRPFLIVPVSYVHRTMATVSLLFSPFCALLTTQTRGFRRYNERFRDITKLSRAYISSLNYPAPLLMRSHHRSSNPIQSTFPYEIYKVFKRDLFSRI